MNKDKRVTFDQSVVDREQDKYMKKLENRLH